MSDAETAGGDVTDATEWWERLHDRRGENTATAKLDSDSVREIRRRYDPETITHRELAAEYGVSHTAIGRVLRGEKWGHIGDPEPDGDDAEGTPA